MSQNNFRQKLKKTHSARILQDNHPVLPVTDIFSTAKCLNE